MLSLRFVSISLHPFGLNVVVRIRFNFVAIVLSYSSRLDSFQCRCIRFVLTSSLRVVPISLRSFCLKVVAQIRFNFAAWKIQVRKQTWLVNLSKTRKHWTWVYEKKHKSLNSDEELVARIRGTKNIIKIRSSRIVASDEKHMARKREPKLS